MVARLRAALAPTQRISGGDQSTATHLALVGLRGGGAQVSLRY